MKIKLLSYIHIGIAILMIVTILMQQRGGGLSSAFGGSSVEYSTKRGAEKMVFYATIVLAALFLGISVTRLLL